MNQQLELHSLSKKYKKSESYANDNINLRFNKGEITAIAGHNGAGKTTMLNQIIGITKSTKGSITFNGLSFARDSKIAREYVLYDASTTCSLGRYNDGSICRVNNKNKRRQSENS
ncbi:ATP-binding cassette domain-containing protein [Enterococcus faecalis]